jgi:hypothetical protein
MGAKNFETLKNNVGTKTFDSFEKRVTPDLFTKENEEKLLNEAAGYIEHLPIVTSPFKEFGIITTNNCPDFIHVFQPNLWAQDIAHANNKLHLMTIGSTYERAQAAAEQKVKTPSVRARLKKEGKTEYEFVEAYIISCLLESGYYSRIGGIDMSETNKKRIDAGIMRRALRNPGLMDTVARALDFDKNDNTALFQVSRELDLTDILQDVSEGDAYFNRRVKQIEEFSAINSRESINWESPINGGNVGEQFQYELFTRIAKRKGADSWLLRQLESLFRKK